MMIVSRDGEQIVSLSEAKRNSRVTTTAEDSNFQMWLDIAHSYVESYSSCVLQLSTCESVFFGCEIGLNTPVRGLISVTLVDKDGAETVTTDYTLTKTHDYGLEIKLKATPENYVVVRYKAGFGEFTATTETPIYQGTIDPYPQLKSAILLLTNHFYENRGIVTDFNKYELPVSIHNILNQVKKYL